MVYADYLFYATEYCGNAISESDFDRLALRASVYLDYYTQGKAAQNADLPALKMACCALAEQYQILDAAQTLAAKSLMSSACSDSAELQSESVGSWSQSYRSGGDSASAASAAQKNASEMLSTMAALYLSGTNLLYRGRGCRKCPPCSPTL